MDDKHGYCECRRRVEEGAPPVPHFDVEKCMRDGTHSGWHRPCQHVIAEIMRLEGRVAELEAEVAAREARCGVLVARLREWADGAQVNKSPGEMTDYDLGWDAALEGMLTLASPDLAASRLLAGKRFADADLAQFEHQPCQVCQTAGSVNCIEWQRVRHDRDVAFVAYREAVAAEEKADEPA